MAEYIPVARIADMLLNPGEQYDYTARHADIVFPATTTLEREDIGGGRRDTHLIAMHQATDPVGDARDDYAILSCLAARLGFGEEGTERRTAREWLVHLYEGRRADLVAEGHAVPAFAEFWQAGQYPPPAGPSHFTLFEDFRADPDARRLRTPSGRIEIVSETVRGFGYPECPGHPAWLEPDEQTTAETPLVLIANQTSTRLHSQLDVGALSQGSRIRGREPVRIHPADAAARGIADGDLVRIFNSRGACLGRSRADRGIASRRGPIAHRCLVRSRIRLRRRAVVRARQPQRPHRGRPVLEAVAGLHRPARATRHRALRRRTAAGHGHRATGVDEKGRPVSTPATPVTSSSAALIPPAFDQLADVTAFLAERAEGHDREASFPFEGVERVHRAGLLTATVGERHGGAGVRLAGTVRILRALGAGDPSVALVSAMTLFTHAHQGSKPTWPQAAYRALLEESAQTPALVNALRVEPDLGTPARGGLPATTARADGDDWVLTGRKIFSTGAPGLRWLAVWARTDEEPVRVGSFLVPAAASGLSVEPTWDHLGLRASGSHDVVLDGVRIPREATAGLSDPSAPDPRLDPSLIAWNNLGLSALYLGVAEAARDWLVGFLHERTPSALGRPLATLPRFQAEVGEIEAALVSALALVEALAERVDAGDRSAAEHSGAAKLIGTRAAIGAVERAVALIGNNALTRRNPLERHLRDVLCSRVHTPQDDSITASLGAAVLARHTESADFNR